MYDLDYFDNACDTEDDFRLNRKELERRLNEALSLQRSGDLHGSMHKLSDLLALSPGHPALLACLANVQRELGLYADAANSARQSVQRAPFVLTSSGELFFALWDCGDIRGALEEALRFCKLRRSFFYWQLVRNVVAEFEEDPDCGDLCTELKALVGNWAAEGFEES